jgi:hypothetical protein
MADKSKATPLELAYSDACAVFTRPFIFCEWKVYAVPSADSTKWAPLGVSKDKSTSYREITHDVWIYVFRKFEGTEATPPVWIEEIFHAKDGTLSVAPVAEQLAHLSGNPKVEPKTRPAVKEIGKTTTFARRINGRRTLHYLFASRVRLPLPSVYTLMTGWVGAKLIKAMMIDQWAPAYSFEKDDINLLEKDGKLIVAVVDPITIALHLHTYADAAAQDCIDYGGDLSEKQGGRQSKVMLARILQSLLAADQSLYQDVYLEGANEEQTWNPYAVDSFLEEYNYQIGYRQQWRIRWHTFLVNWLDSEPFQVAFRVFCDAAPLEALLLICRLLRRISVSELGRGLLLRINSGKPNDADDKWGWVSQHIFPAESEPAPVWEMIDKASGNTIGAVLEWAPFVSTGVIPPKYVIQAINAPLAVRLGVKPATKIITEGFGSVPQPQFWRGKHGIEYVKYQIDPGKASEIKGKYAYGFAWADMALKVVSAAFAAKEIAEALGPDADYKKKTVAIITGIHTVADLGASAKEIQGGYKRFAAELAEDESKETAEAIEKYEIAASRLAALAAITDYVIGVKDTITSLREGETGEGVGHLVSTVGYGLEFVGSLAAALSVPGLGVLIMIGGALVIIGNTIVKIFKKTDYQRFVRHCYWGPEYGETGPKKEWAVAPFEQWKDRYDLQLKSLIELLCQFEIDEDRWKAKANIPSDPEKIRAVEVKLGWLPMGARIEVTYDEVWDGNGTQKLQGTWTVTDQNSGTGEYTFEAKEGNTLRIKLKDHELEVSPLGKSPREDLVHQTDEQRHSYFWWNKDFRDLKVGMRLTFALGKGEITVPYEEKKFKEGTVVHNEKELPESHRPTR